MLTYKAQQRDGAFWDRTALKTRYDSIRIPTFLIGGWYDCYRDSIPRMLQNVKAPVKAIIGPWNHTYPSDPYPKPGMEWRHEAVRWFDQWLKGRNTGIMEEPRFAVYVQQWHPPGPYLEEAPGEWRYEDGWPIKRIQEEILYPRPDRTLGKAPAGEGADLLRYVPTTQTGTCFVEGWQLYLNCLTFTVTHVSASLPYSPSENRDADGDSNGTSITVCRPELCLGGT